MMNNCNQIMRTFFVIIPCAMLINTAHAKKPSTEKPTQKSTHKNITTMYISDHDAKANLLGKWQTIGASFSVYGTILRFNCETNELEVKNLGNHKKPRPPEKEVMLKEWCHPKNLKTFTIASENSFTNSENNINMMYVKVNPNLSKNTLVLSHDNAIRPYKVENGYFTLYRKADKSLWYHYKKIAANNPKEIK